MMKIGSTWQAWLEKNLDGFMISILEDSKTQLEVFLPRPFKYYTLSGGISVEVEGM